MHMFSPEGTQVDPQDPAVQRAFLEQQLQQMLMDPSANPSFVEEIKRRLGLKPGTLYPTHPECLSDAVKDVAYLEQDRTDVARGMAA